ncbi:hypothetical protein MRX96_055437 [Rhipicephalus microplus]
MPLRLESANGSAIKKTVRKTNIRRGPIESSSFSSAVSTPHGPAQSRRSHPDAPSPEDPGSMVSRTASRHVRSAEASLVSAPEILNPKLFPDIEQPAFDNSTPRNVTTQQMQTVYLHCIVNNLGERTVSRHP